MFLHLGNDHVVRSRDVIGIFDIENTSTTQRTREYLKTAQRQGQVVNVTDELPKSFVVCRTAQGETAVYLSQISVATLKKRAGEVL